MKSFVRYSSLFIVAGLLTACNHDQTVIGNGTITTQAQKVADFDQVKVVGDFNVVASHRWPQRVNVTTDSNIQQYVNITVSNDVLTIQPKQGYDLKPTAPITVDIATRDLKSMAATGMSTVNITGISEDNFKFDAKGATRATLAGRVDDAKFDVDGAASIDAKALMAKNAKIDIKGAAEASIYASKKLDVNIEGSSHVTYFGKPPVINQSVFGGGELKQGTQTS